MVKKTKKEIVKKSTKKGSGMSAGKILAIGAGIAAASAGAYAFLGPNGKKNQKKAKVWMAKMEKEIAVKMKDVKNASMPIYHSAVDAIAESYSKEYKMHSAEIQAFAKKLKSQWTSAEKKALKK